MPMAPKRENWSVPRKTFKASEFGWSLYQHVAAVFAAFGLAALIGHFWRIGWVGFLKTLVGVWDETIRPVMTWVFHILISVPLGWIGVDFELPQLARDYLSVGLILTLSYLRTLRTAKDILRPRNVRFFRKVPLALELTYLIGLWPIAMLATGVALGLTLARGRDYYWRLPSMDVPSSRWEEHMAEVVNWQLVGLRRSWARLALLAFVRVASPLLYVGLLLAVNRWVL